MADNTRISAGTNDGDTIATDDIGGVKHQLVKVEFGAADSATPVSSANPFPVGDAGGSLTVDNAGTFAVQADTELTTADLDTGAGTDTRAVVGLVIAKSGGAANISASDPLPISDAGSSITVDGTVTANAGSGPWPVTDNSGSLTVDAPVGTPVFVRLSDGSSAISTLPVSIAAAVAVTDNSGSLTVDAPVGTPVFTTVTPSTTGGWSKQMYAAQTTTLRAVKASAGTFGGYYAYNPNASAAYIQVFDVASGSVTLGTTTPNMIFAIPAGSGANLEITNGVNMGTAITIACTTTATGNTAPGTGLDLTFFYK